MTTPAPAPAPLTTRMASAETGPRFRDLVAAEWIKLRSLRSTYGAFGVTFLTVLAFNVGLAYDTWKYWTGDNASDRAGFIRDGMPLQHAFSSNASAILVLALGAIGALAIAGEYSSGTIRTTFAAVPARRPVMAAKAVVLATVTTVFGLAVALSSFFATQAILGARGVGVSLGDPGALRVVLAAALLAPVAALAGLALGALIRQTATTMVVSTLVLLVLPMMFSDDRRWSATVAHLLPYRAWDRLAAAVYKEPEFAWTTGGAWTVYALWALASVLVAAACVQRRDQ